MITVPWRLVRWDDQDDEVIPWLLDRRDVPWLREVISVFEAGVGMPRNEVEARLHRPPAARLFRLVAHVLWQLYPTRVASPIAPREIRRTLFTAAAAAEAPPSPGTRGHQLEAAAGRLEITPDEVPLFLLSDLPDERVVQPFADPHGDDGPRKDRDGCGGRGASPSRGASPGPGANHNHDAGQLRASLSPESLALFCNTAILQAVLRRAERVDLRVHGNARLVIRTARLFGLMSTLVRGHGPESSAEVSFSGPLTMLGQATRYGNAFAKWLPVLPWSRSFRLTAHCRMGGPCDTTRRLVLRSGAPIDPGTAPREHDSEVERRFARDFQREPSARDWELAHEPEPMRVRRVPGVGDAWIFPDFEVRCRSEPRRRFFVEVVGFWTEAYLTHKLTTLREARIDPLVLCVDESLACNAAAAPEGARVIGFRRRVDVVRVMQLGAAMARSGASSKRRKASQQS